MKFEIIGNISNIEILIALKFTLNDTKNKTEIQKISKLGNDLIYVQYKTRKTRKIGKVIPQSFIRDCKIQNIISNLSIDDEIKKTIELIKKKLFISNKL
jgi:hypothetical protein